MFFAQKRGKLFGVPTGAHPLPWMGPDAPTTARIGTCRPMGYSPTSVPEGFQRANGKPFGAPAGADLLPVGSDAPTAARTMGLPPRRGIVLSFGAKESTKESKRHGATEKRLLLPILTAGLAMSRAMKLAGFHIRAERARAHLFPPSKWAGLFPSAAYRRPAPAQLAGAYSTLAAWDETAQTECLCNDKRPA